MNGWKRTRINSRISGLKSFFAIQLLLVTIACGQPSPVEWDTDSGVLMKSSEDFGIPEEIKKVEMIVPRPVMKNSGLAGAMGGVNLKAQKAGIYDVLIPLPQLADGQVPVTYRLSAEPKTVLEESRLQEREDGNVFVSLKLKVNKGQEVTIKWFSTVLVADKKLQENPSSPEVFKASTACVQANDPKIKKLAEDLWPPTEKMRDYAINIQKYIREMKPQKHPRSLDAVGVLESGQNTICTANANLACALMRAKQIACRSIAVLPTNSYRLEMHRIVEYFDNKAWVPFDPSGVFADIPLKPWQNIIMAKTNVEDEEISMKPRIGSTYGCPFGQEAEFARPGLYFHPVDQTFFWTIAVPLAEFEITNEIATITEDFWGEFLKTGTLNTAQIKAVSTRNFDQFYEVIRTH